MSYTNITPPIFSMNDTVESNKFLEDNVEDSLLTKFAEGKEARQARRRAIFQGIKDVFGRTQE